MNKNPMRIRDRSYKVRVQRGDRVAFTEPTRVGWKTGEDEDGNWQFGHRTVEVGEQATVVAESNAGFRGIEARLVLEGGERVSVSTGRLEII